MSASASTCLMARAETTFSPSGPFWLLLPQGKMAARGPPLAPSPKPTSKSPSTTVLTLDDGVLGAAGHDEVRAHVGAEGRHDLAPDLRGAAVPVPDVAEQVRPREQRVRRGLADGRVRADVAAALELRELADELALGRAVFRAHGVGAERAARLLVDGGLDEHARARVGLAAEAQRRHVAQSDAAVGELDVGDVGAPVPRGRPAQHRAGDER